MKTKRLLLLLLIVSFQALGQNQQWATKFNSSGSQKDAGYAVTSDASGNVYVTGRANWASGQDDYVKTIKYNTSGVQQWATTTNLGYNSGNADREQGYAIAVDANGYVWVSASTYTGTTNYADLTLIRYDNSGSVQTNYPKQWSDASGTSFIPMGTCISVYDPTNVYIAGSTYNGTTASVIVLKDNVNASGWNWSWTYAGSGVIGQAQDLKSTSSYVYVTGIIGGSNGADCVTAKLSASNGSQSWATTYNNSTYNLNDIPLAMVVDGSGTVYVAGSTATNSNGTDGLLIQYNSSGVQQWVTPYNDGSYNKDEAWTDIALSANGSSIAVYVGGYRTKTSDCDYSVAAYNSSGSFANGTGLWSTADPVFYDGAASAPENVGTDVCWALEYSSSTDRVYITGRSCELVSSTKTVNITSRGYNGTTGANTWSKSYDYGSDNVIGDDNMFMKYGLAIRYYDDGCHGAADHIYVEGDTYVANEDRNYITLSYGPTGSCQRVMGPNRVYEPVMPNPFSETAVLFFNLQDLPTNGILTIYDIAGKKVREIKNITANSLTIERGDLSDGLYFYTFVDDPTVYKNGKFIIAGGN